MNDGLFSSLYKQIPTNIRLLGESIVGKTDPITAKDFTAEELAYIQKQVSEQETKNKEKIYLLQQGIPQITDPKLKKIFEKDLATYKNTENKTNISYTNYPQGLSAADTNWWDAFVKSISSPEFNVATSLGQYTAIKDSSGNMVIVDKYNWDNEKKLIEEKLKNKDYRGILSLLTDSPQSTLATLMSSFLPSRQREVKIEFVNPNVNPLLRR
jgi:hypothetical protein